LASGYAADRYTPSGVVVDYQGPHPLVRQAGRAMVLCDGQAWDSELAWLSDTASGAVTGRMPYTARNEMVIVGRRVGSANNGHVEMLIEPPRYVCQYRQVAWEYDSETYIDLEYLVLPGGGLWRMVFCLEGNVVAILDEEKLRIAGERVGALYESNTVKTASKSRNGEIEYQAAATLYPAHSSISFAIDDPGAPGSYTQVAEMLSNGDFCYGEFQTNGSVLDASVAAEFGNSRYRWDGTRKTLDLTVDGHRPYLRFNDITEGGIVNARVEVADVWSGAL
jgi:hypothetical protein